MLEVHRCNGGNDWLITVNIVFAIDEKASNDRNPHDHETDYCNAPQQHGSPTIELFVLRV
ncbi:hypothetical protein HED51_01285 [Ochrobactrum grignonense]|nr:hypothetical protein [Brucella grignonensis]